jgi:hypothetical protein
VISIFHSSFSLFSAGQCLRTCQSSLSSLAKERKFSDQVDKIHKNILKFIAEALRNLNISSRERNLLVTLFGKSEGKSFIFGTVRND